MMVLHFFYNLRQILEQNNIDMSSWFKRKNKGIQTPTDEKKDTPKGLWYKTPSGKIIDSDDLKENLYVSPEDGYHVRIGSAEYFEIFFDNNEFKELDAKLSAKDPLSFVDTKKYTEYNLLETVEENTEHYSNRQIEKAKQALENCICPYK